MTSTLKEWVWIYKLPVRLPELQKKGYSHFRFDVIEGESQAKRIQLKAWKDVKQKKNLLCEGTKRTECGVRYFSNRIALEVHQRKHGHGKYEFLKIPA